MTILKKKQIVHEKTSEKSTESKIETGFHARNSHRTKQQKKRHSKFYNEKHHEIAFNDYYFMTVSISIEWSNKTPAKFEKKHSSVECERQLN